MVSAARITFQKEVMQNGGPNWSILAPSPRCSVMGEGMTSRARTVARMPFLRVPCHRPAIFKKVGIQ